MITLKNYCNTIVINILSLNNYLWSTLLAKGQIYLFLRSAPASLLSYSYAREEAIPPPPDHPPDCAGGRSKSWGVVKRNDNYLFDFFSYFFLFPAAAERRASRSTPSKEGQHPSFLFIFLFYPLSIEGLFSGTAT